MRCAFRILVITAVLFAVAIGIAGYALLNRYRTDKKLDDLLIAFFRSSQGRPWQWKAKEVIYDYLQVRRALLVRRDFMGKNSEIRMELRQLEKELRDSLDWQEPIREYEIPCLPQEQCVNGYPSPEFWKKHALAWRGEYPLSQTNHKKNSAIWQLCYDAEYLYFRASFPDRSRFLDKGKKLYEQDAFELFILPEIRYYTYVELVVSRDNRRYVQWVNQTVRSRYELSDYTPRTLETKTQEYDGKWEIAGRIGFADLPGYLRGNPAKSGESLRLMMLRIDCSGNGGKQFFSPVPFLYDGHNFFGYMKFILQ